MNPYAQQQLLLSEQMPKYRKWAVWLILIVHLCVFVTSLSAPRFGADGLPFLLLGLLVSCFAGCLAFLRSPSHLLHFFVAWSLATFTTKLPICLHHPEQTNLSMLGLDADEMSPIVLESFAYYALGMLTFVVFTLVLQALFPRGKQRMMPEATPATDNIFGTIRFIAIVTLVYYFVLLFVLNIGRAGIAPPQIFFPGVTGVLHLLGQKTAVVIFTSFLALAVTRSTYTSLFWALAVLAVYAVLNLAAGWRRPLLVIVLCIGWYILLLADKKLQARLKPLMLITIVFSVMLFGPIMAFRHSIIHGHMSPLEAIKELANPEVYVSQDYVQILTKISNRFNGLDLYVVCAHSFEEPLGPAYLFNGQFHRMFNVDVVGAPEWVVVSFASTVWGFWYAVLGKGMLWSCGAFLAVFVFVSERFCGMLSKDKAALAVCEFNTVLWLNSFMATGKFLETSKSGLILALSLYVFCKFIWNNPAMRAQSHRWAMQMQYYRTQ
ncbi:MAG: hypothetical protein MI725_01195 [Pirellulales bacterium]|nr:hypothetical protein [Pirellulales bacterium]